MSRSAHDTPPEPSTPRGSTPRRQPGARTKSARRQFTVTILALEAFVVFFAALVAYGLDLAEPSVIWAAGGGLVVLCVVSAALLRSRVGYVLGTLVQVLLVALGLVVPMMIVVGVVFGVLWLVALRLGGQIDVERAERARLEREHADAAASGASQAETAGDSASGSGGDR